MLGIQYFIPSLAADCAACRRTINALGDNDVQLDRLLYNEEQLMTDMSITPAGNTSEIKLKAATLFAAANGDFSCLDVAGLMLLRSIFADIERL
jgi:hypothetical protein